MVPEPLVLEMTKVSYPPPQVLFASNAAPPPYCAVKYQLVAYTRRLIESPLWREPPLRSVSRNVWHEPTVVPRAETVEPPQLSAETLYPFTVVREYVVPWVAKLKSADERV